MTRERTTPGVSETVGVSTYDVVVVGAGLAGLFAGALAASRGARTLVVARGLGGTHLGPGTVDVWGYAPHPPSRQARLVSDPEAALRKRRAKHHPLRLAGTEALREALDEFKTICETAGYPLVGALHENFFLPTALGAVRPTCLAPQSFQAGDVRQPGELTLARLPGFRDFFADLAAANLNAAGYEARAISLDLPRAPARRDAFSTDLARLFDDSNYRAEVAHRWRAPLKGVTRLGLPAILGLTHAAAARRDLADRLGVEIFEIPILPPSVPGMRLFDVLRTTTEAAGGRVTLGPSVTGWVNDGRALGVIAETAGGPRKYAARAIILATGGFRHGGLDSPARGQVRESVFGLPVVTGKKWFAPFYWQAQPYTRFGVRVNERMQPVDAKGHVIYPNVFAVGGVLAGADRNGEGSREGIDLATAWMAVNGLNGLSRC